MRLFLAAALLGTAPLIASAQEPAQPTSSPARTATVLHAARLLDVAAGRTISPGEVLVEGNLIREVGKQVNHPAGAKVIDLGDTTLMPGLIDAHVHLFLHVGNEANQTVDESVPERVLIAADAAKADLMAGFTAERDMGTEGAGCADVAVRNAINKGMIPGPRMRMSCNAIDINGGHEDNGGRNPDEHLLSNADRADTADDIIRVMREQHKQGADFTKMYETGRDSLQNGVFSTPYQYTEAELATAVAEAKRTGSRVAVHATGEPGTGFAVAAGVVSVDHADLLSPATMRLMKDRGIFAVPTFAIGEYFADHAGSPNATARRRESEAFHAAEFRKQIAAGVPFAAGSDVGPFPHGTQAHEFVLMNRYGMPAADVLRADLLNGAKLLGWETEIGQLKAGFLADVIAVPGDPVADISVTEHVTFVMKNGEVVRQGNQ
ncbi:MAG: amidohydrolase family protein [Janthinobacterium lividum]